MATKRITEEVILAELRAKFRHDAAPRTLPVLILPTMEIVERLCAGQPGSLKERLVCAALRTFVMDDARLGEETALMCLALIDALPPIMGAICRAAKGLTELNRLGDSSSPDASPPTIRCCQ